jgi:hypothetical protein
MLPGQVLLDAIKIFFKRTELKMKYKNKSYLSLLHSLSDAALGTSELNKGLKLYSEMSLATNKFILLVLNYGLYFLFARTN